ncbi:MAG: 50S ribosomal protein L22 [Candidatus Staskawiczbacteria bacterium]|nr:50S ribosomal protein L22 [Candidatus Staskawiczbacteria bacterium]
MQVTAKLKHLRITARKVRQVADLIRGKKVADAKVLLSFTARKPVIPILKLLVSAVASARHNFQVEEDNLYISKITVDEGPTLKRWHAMSRGRAYPIMKRSSHITLLLSEINPKKVGKSKSKSKKNDA